MGLSTLADYDYYDYGGRASNTALKRSVESACRGIIVARTSRSSMSAVSRGRGIWKGSKGGRTAHPRRRHQFWLR